MKARPKIVGWEISTNENNVEMATMPLDKFIALMVWAEEAEQEIKELREKVEKLEGNVATERTCKQCGTKFKAISHDTCLDCFKENYGL